MVQPARWLILGVFALLPAGCGSKTELEPVLLGHLAPASGADPAAAEHARQGIRLAVDEANKEEGQRRVEVVHPECPNDLEALRAAAVRLVTVNKVAALLGGTDPTQVEVLAQVAESWKVPLVAPAGPAGRAASAQVFHTGISPADQGRTFARFAARELAVKSVAVLTGSREGRGTAGNTLAGAFASELRKAGGVIQGEWAYQNANELKDPAGRLASGKPDAVVLAGSVKDLAALHQAGLPEQTAVLFAGAEGSLATLRAEPLHRPVYLATAYDADEGPAQAQDFARKYQEHFHEPPDEQAALAYDSARLVIEAVHRAKAWEEGKLQQALAEQKTLDSVTGLMYLQPNHWVSRTVYVVRLENGQAKVVKVYEPERAGKQAASSGGRLGVGFGSG